MLTRRSEQSEPGRITLTQVRKEKHSFAKVLIRRLYILIYVSKERWFQNLLFKKGPGLFLPLPVTIHSKFLFHQAIIKFQMKVTFHNCVCFPCVLSSLFYAGPSHHEVIIISGLVSLSQPGQTESAGLGHCSDTLGVGPPLLSSLVSWQIVNIQCKQ